MQVIWLMDFFVHIVTNCEKHYFGIQIPLDVLDESENLLSNNVMAGLVSSFTWFFKVFLLSDGCI